MSKRPTVYRQGDVFLIRAKARKVAALKPVPREDGAVVLAHGEVTGHRHQIRSGGCALYALEDNRLTGEEAAQAIARIGGGLIPDRLLVADAPVDLLHEEHDKIRLPAGSYIVRIQREYSPGELRSVQD